ncbi:Transporter, LysE family [plant metagenome]|uniref:Transporter, LysE family n=1 Tax=plant metagenome TaxID=1297885 RepID=A0A484PF53_9ZZZZ
MIDLSAWLQGFVLGLGMFICPGPKDVLILREALAGRSPLQLIGIGTGSDVVLIALGILGLSAALQAAPSLQWGAQVFGIALLLLHGALAARSAFSHRGPASHTRLAGASGSRGLRQLLFVSLFNPAAWLDTVLVIGTVGAALPVGLRASYAAGAVTASLAWFVLWVLGARQTRRWMGSAHAWRLLDAGIALAMMGMAFWIACGL